ncbi:reticulon-like protein B5 [Lotus japonicus]|uniref:reticulon-like protein B5 n=1 Tax=Lotus japonicus TaxID=34305 RepID=UPI00258FB52E|nr:reticulon-like protein B5 [Lotus japonicus]
MPQSTGFMDVADSDFLSNKEPYDDESEFDSEFEKYFVFSSAKNRFFGRTRSLHIVLGSGKIADIILWRDKRNSTSVLTGVTLLWILFKSMDYTLLSFICDSLILLLAMLFLWTHLTTFIDIPPPKLSAFILPHGLLVDIAHSMTSGLNKLLIIFGVLASGRDFKKFLLVTLTLGAVSVFGRWFTAATIIYIGSVILFIVPAVYERHGAFFDIIAEKAMIELSNRYAELMNKFSGNSHSQNLQDSILD